MYQRIKRHWDIALFGVFIAIIALGALVMTDFSIGSVFASGNGDEPPVALDPEEVEASYLYPGFTYQGYIENGDSPVDSRCDFRFRLYYDDAGVTQVGEQINRTNLAVDRGVFSTKLDFGQLGTRLSHWLEVDVRCPSGSGGYSTLSPLTEITAAPVAHSLPNVYSDGVSGRVGIGTSNPSEALDVYGGIEARKYFYVSHQGGQSLVRLGHYVGTDRYGYVVTNGTNGIRDTYVGSNGDSDGDIRVYSSNGSTKVRQSVSSTGNGYVVTYGANGNANIFLNGIGSGNNHGWMGVYDDSGTNRTKVFVYTNDVGGLETLGPNGNANFRVGSSSASTNYGWVGIQDSSGNSQASMYIDSSGRGVVWGDIKNFRVANPDQPGTDIWYASLEGPEAAAYTRGTAQLVNGQVRITLPDHFRSVASNTGMTVQLTPLSAESLGLAVVEKSLDGIVVQELHDGKGNYEFDFIVTAIRAGYEDYEVIRPSDEAEPYVEENIEPEIEPLPPINPENE